MFTITTKIIAAYTLIFGVMLILFAYVIYRSSVEAEMTKLDARLESHADKIATELEEDNDEPTFPDVKSLLALRTEGLSGAIFQVIDREGKFLIADSSLGSLTGIELNEIFGGAERKEVRQIHAQSYRCLWLRAEIENHYPYVVQLAAPMTDVESAKRRLWVLFLTAIPLALLLTALAAYAITRIAFRPMTGMAESARQITAERLDRRLLLPASHDEVRMLGETFNTMLDRIDVAFNSQRQFIADASHELRTPLTVICTELEYIRERLKEPLLRESIETSISEIDRLAKLADGLLLLAKLDASQLRLDLQPVRLDELLVECVQRIRAMAELKKIDVTIEISEAIEIAGDRERLKSVILNLLDNAVKYSNPQTVVSATLGYEMTEHQHALIRITDQGIGIPASELENIFKRFFRIDQSRGEAQGSGLGLAIVERLVQLHGGTISVKSSPGDGSTFIVRLPTRIKG